MDFESKITIRQAYQTMVEYLNRYWNETGQPDEIGNILGELSLWDSAEGKIPMDSAVFPRWLDCANKVVTDENTENGYGDADVELEN